MIQDITDMEMDELDFKNLKRSEGWKGSPNSRMSDKAIDEYIKELEATGDRQKAERKFFDNHK